MTYIFFCLHPFHLHGANEKQIEDYINMREARRNTVSWVDKIYIKKITVILEIFLMNHGDFQKFILNFLEKSNNRTTEQASYTTNKIVSIANTNTLASNTTTPSIQSLNKP